MSSASVGLCARMSNELRWHVNKWDDEKHRQQPLFMFIYPYKSIVYIRIINCMSITTIQNTSMKYFRGIVLFYHEAPFYKWSSSKNIQIVDLNKHAKEKPALF